MAAVPPEEPFSLTPANSVVGPLVYSRPSDLKIYKTGIKATSPNPFNCEAEGLYQFLGEIQNRANEMGWMEGILNVNIAPEGEEEILSNIIHNYGSITLEQVRRWERSYIATHSRAAQDSYMLYLCLFASLTSEATKKVMLWSEQYMIEVGGVSYSSGVALLKVIIRESHLDTNATTNAIRTKLSSLDTYITTVDCDIGRFNQYVKLLIQSLTARNQDSTDLLVNLFKGYSAVSDESFRTWLTRKLDDHEEGRYELTPDSLMIAAKNRYDSMIEKGAWNAPTAEEKIVALEAKLTTSMKNLDKKVSFELGKKGKGAGKTKPTDSKGGKQKTSKAGAGSHPKHWAAPKPGDKKTIEYNGYNWHWCGKDTGGKCEKWRAHEPSECRGAATRTSQPKSGKRHIDDKKKKPTSTPTSKKLKVARAYVAKLEQRATEEEGTDNDSD